MARLLKFGCLGIIALAILVVIVAALAGGQRGTQQAQPATTPTPAPKAAETPKTTEPAKPAADAPKPAEPAKAPADPNRGIVFGTPIKSATGAAVLVTNTTDDVKSFIVRATWKQGETILATANGAVNDLRPGMRQATALSSTDRVPDQYESVRTEVNTMIREATTTPAAEAASKISFGPPKQSKIGLDVEATNGDSAAHSFIVIATFLKGGELSGMGSGAVNDLEPGQTKTVTLSAGTGGVPERDETLISVGTVVK
jgi:hypothetical protein